jgi:RHS repeat-associated protein
VQENYWNGGILSRRIEMTRPDNVKSVQYVHSDSSQFNYGLLYQAETYSPTGTLLHKSFVNWELGAYDSPRPSRIEITDERDQKTGTEFSYGSSFNQVIETREYDYGYTFGGGNTLLRKTKTEYLNDPNYTAQGPYWRHIFNLVTANEVYASNGTTRLQRTEYFYDEFKGAGPNGLQDTPGIVYSGHDLASNPYSSGYNPVTEYRGNVTTIKRYADAANLTGAITETQRYDITGNVVKIIEACCEQTTFTYTLDTQYTYPSSQAHGSTDGTVQNTSSATYDFNTGLTLSTTDPNGRIAQTDYDAGMLRPLFEYLPTTQTSGPRAYLQYLYDEVGLIVYDILCDAGGNIASRSDKYIDGHGRVQGEVALAALQAPNHVWDVVETKYDGMGRIWKQSRPYRLGSETPQFYLYEYDPLDRLKQVTAPGTDNGSVQRIYNESGAGYPSSATQGAPGTTMKVVDQWGRQRWGRTDALGRLVELVEPNPASTTGSVFEAGNMVTRYSYDTINRLTQVVQGDQTRTFNYDALSRLTHQKLAEREATLNDSGGAGNQWSDVFTYDERSNLITHTDARRVRTTFSYYNTLLGAGDPLNRLQSVSYDKSQAPQAAVIPDAPTISYEYQTTGDRMRLLRITTTGFATEEWAYDPEKRLSQRTLTFTSQPSKPLVTSYLYDSASFDRPKELTYPKQYGQVGEPRRIVQPEYDVANRWSGLKLDGSYVASQLVYNASSQTTSLVVGPSANQVSESYTYDATNGLLTNQKVLRAGSPLLDLSYDYLRTTGSGRTGQLTKITNNKTYAGEAAGSRNRSYEYGALGRLKLAKGGPFAAHTWSQTYTYDRYGNRENVAHWGTAGNGTAIPRDGLPTLSYNTASNRITSANFEYDAAGNQTRAVDESGTIRRYRYDAAGRLAQVLTDDEVMVVASYSYGVTNQRLKGVENGVATYYAWGGSAVIAEYGEVAGALNWNKSYVYLDNRLLQTQAPAETQYHHPDRLGTRLVTNSAGQGESEQAVLPFGAALDAESGAIVTSRRFTSYERSGVTKLDYAINRFYNAAQGRFTQVDPIEMEAVNLEDPQTLNLYAYCSNDPINHLDPDGLFFGKLFRAIGKIFKKIIKWAVIAIAVAVAVAVVLAYAGAIAVAGAIMAGVTIAGSVLAYLGVVGIPGLAIPGPLTPPFNPNASTPSLGGGGGDIWVTPPFNPNAGTGVGGVSSFLPQRLGGGRGAVRRNPRRGGLPTPPRRLPRDWRSLPMQYHHFIPWTHTYWRHHEHRLVKQAELSQRDLKMDPRNGEVVIGHAGPHSASYHQEVQRRMDRAYDRVKGQGRFKADQELGEQYEFLAGQR